MKNKHTPGEWIASRSGNPNFRTCIVSEDGGSICHVSNWPEFEANAKLIAAAPDLLAVCESIEEVYAELMADDSPKLPMKKFEYLSSLVSKSREAIKKATP